MNYMLITIVDRVAVLVVFYLPHLSDDYDDDDVSFVLPRLRIL